MRAICLQTPYICLYTPGGVAPPAASLPAFRRYPQTRHRFQSGITISYELKRHVYLILCLPTSTYLPTYLLAYTFHRREHFPASKLVGRSATGFAVCCSCRSAVHRGIPTGGEKLFVAGPGVFGEREMSYGRKFLCSRFWVQWHADYSVMQFPKHLSFTLNAYNAA